MTVTPSFEMSGSMLAGTAEHRLVGIETHLDVSTEHDAATVGALVDQAERMCFVMNAITETHLIATTTTCNGVAL
ncbi:MAG: hypothetical protein ACR2QO_15420 [Acidimicrobiales bacterium]